MANNKVKFEDDCGGLKPIPIVKKKGDTSATKKKIVKGTKKKK